MARMQCGVKRDIGDFVRVRTTGLDALVTVAAEVCLFVVLQARVSILQVTTGSLAGHPGRRDPVGMGV